MSINNIEQRGGGRPDIRQGDLFWIEADESRGSVPGIAHPHVVVQEDVINRSRVRTVVVCALTTNAKCANEPGNVTLSRGEGNLSKTSYVVVSQVSSVDKALLGEYIGTLSQDRVQQILSGMNFQQASFFNR